MNSQKYNGWTNYATWRINLEIIDGMTLEYFDIKPEDASLVDVYELEEALKERAEDWVVQSAPPGLARDYALAFMSDVNWYEIAKHMIDDCVREYAKG